MLINPFNKEKFSLLPQSILLFILIIVSLFFISNKIDFHPDEAIYFNFIPINIRSDNGLSYNLFYSLFLFVYPETIAARWASCVLGAISWTSFFLIMMNFFPNREKVTFIVSYLCALSVPSLFVFVRVRPEAMWICMTFVIVKLLLDWEKNRDNQFVFGGLIFLLSFLPCNHKLSLFPLLFILLYLFLKLFDKRYWAFYGILFLAPFIGLVFFHFIARALLTEASVLEVFSQFLNSAKQEFGPLDLINGYFLGLSWIGDKFGTQSWMSLIGLKYSHFEAIGFLWLLSSLLIFGARNKVELGILCFPAFSFVVMILASYVNVTYIFTFTIFALAGSVYLALKTQINLAKTIGLSIALLFFCISLSFLNTRILSHGEANFWTIERGIISEIEQKKYNSVAVPERYSTIKRFVKSQVFNLHKSNPSNVDAMYFDSLDFCLYGGNLLYRGWLDWASKFSTTRESRMFYTYKRDKSYRDKNALRQMDGYCSDVFLRESSRFVITRYEFPIK